VGWCNATDRIQNPEAQHTQNRIAHKIPIVLNPPNHKQCSTASSNMPRQNQKPTKSVAFANNVLMSVSLHISDYNEQEIQACFYNISEISEFKQDVKRTARMIETKQDIDDVDVCRRGAEHMTEEATNIRHQKRRAVVFEVLTEQFWAEENPGTPSSERITAKYSKAVRESAASAHVIGLSDEAIVKSNSLVESQKKHLDDESRPNHFATRLFSWKRNGGSIRAH
jgi:hypothetical protein